MCCYWHQPEKFLGRYTCMCVTDGQRCWCNCAIPSCPPLMHPSLSASTSSCEITIITFACQCHETSILGNVEGSGLLTSLEPAQTLAILDQDLVSHKQHHKSFHQGAYIFFSKGKDTKMEQEMNMLLPISKVITCSAKAQQLIDTNSVT